jgi:hypothetical protein
MSGARRALHALTFAFVICIPAAAQPARFDLAITVVGESGRRQTALVTFLEKHFRAVHFVDRKSGKATPPADVVVLDWQQGDYQGGFPMPKPRSPLGERASWKTPAVLLGSAGHNLAAAWDIRGGSG